MDARHLLAFGLIALLIAVGVAATLYARHNSRDNILLRERERHRARRRERGDSE